jgi:hypothetical protein
MTQPEQHDAREGSGDPTTDPAAAGEQSVAAPDADGGAVPDDDPDARSAPPRHEGREAPR